jgi:GTP-binding protein LepA
MSQNWEGVSEILEAIIKGPPPVGDEDALCMRLFFLFLIQFFQGHFCLFQVQNGIIRKGDKVKFLTPEGV